MLRSLGFASSLVLLAGCSFDFGTFGQGGSPATGGSGSTGTVSGVTGVTSSSGAGTGTSGATSTGTGTGSTTSTGASSSSSSSGTGGAPPLAPCGIASDTFDNLDPGVWTALGSVSNSGNKITITTNNTGFAGLGLTAGATYENCYASIEVVSTSTDPNGRAYLGLADLVTLNNSLAAQYLGNHNPTQVAAQPGINPIDAANVTHLGVVFYMGSTRFLYGDSAGWHQFGKVPRAGWQDDAVPDHVGFGVVFAMNNKSAVFDNFNVRPITLGDIP